MNPLLMGIDAGTSGTKVVVFDCQGNIVARGSARMPVVNPKPGWVEQPPIWWENLQEAVNSLWEQGRVERKAIQAIGLTHQRHSFVPVDKNIRPLRNGILWSDVRCVREIREVVETIGAQRVYEASGVRPGPWSIYKMGWFKKNEPYLYDRCYKIVLVHDYLIHRLTGRLVTTISAAAMMGCLDIHRLDCWIKEILSVFNIPESKLVDDIVPAGTVLGRLTEEAAALLGLEQRITVVSAAGDQPCGCIGVGVDNPHVLGMNSGTSLTLETVVPELRLDPNMNYVMEYSPLDLYAPECAIFSGLSDLMNWFKDEFAQSEVAEANDGNANIWETLYGYAVACPPGAGGMLLFPYFQGSNAPYWDPLARGIIVGCHRRTGKAQLVRAIMEGLAYESRRQIELLEDGTKESIDSIRMYGGSAHREIWNQIVADITNRTVEVTNTEEATSLGAAICAAKGVGLHPSIRESMQTMVKVKNIFEPSCAYRDQYDSIYQQVYKPLFGAVQPFVDHLSELNEYVLKKIGG